MKHPKRLAALLPLAFVLLSANAWGTHKAWMLHDAGATCQPSSSSYDADIRYSLGEVSNWNPSSRSVVCPVTLAGRFAASSDPFLGPYSMTQSMRARDGDVFVYDGSSNGNISCYAYSMAQTGGAYYSRSVSSSGTGAQTIHVYDTPNETWGSGMANNDIAIRSIGYRCSLPQWSSIYGYMVNLCQISAAGCET
jgi:hypothetical protein